MNISLTWANYALITGVCLLGYYIVIGIVYYRKDLLRLLQSKQEPASYTRSQQPVTTETNNYQDSSLPSLLDNSALVEDRQQHEQPTVEDFMDEIYAYTQACGNNTTKEELSIGLQRILHKYPSLIGSSLRNILAGVIATACKNNCSIQWSEDELNELWND